MKTVIALFFMWMVIITAWAVSTGVGSWAISAMPNPSSVVIYTTGSDGYPCTMEIFGLPAKNPVTHGLPLVKENLYLTGVSIETSCPQSPADRSIDKP